MLVGGAAGIEADFSRIYPLPTRDREYIRFPQEIGDISGSHKKSRMGRLPREFADISASDKGGGYIRFLVTASR